MTTGYKFPILNSDGTPSTTYVDMDDMFVPAANFYERGLWTWGRNIYGQLGLNDTTNRSSPAQVGSLMVNWKQVGAGSYHTAAIKTDGTLWSWGNNSSGQLGLNDTTNRSSPVQVGTLTNWKLVTGGSNHTAAIKTDGTLWIWGINNNGQLGRDTIEIYRSSPVQVGSLTDWNLISCGKYYTLAIKTDGTLWTWGDNDYGQLGLNDRTHRSSPVQVGSLTNWKQVSGGMLNDTTAAIKTDGTLWTWGFNPYGQLGDGTTVSKSSPIQVGSLNNWKEVSSGAHVSAIKTDGTLWTWGFNFFGQLGDGTRFDRNSPVQVGSLTNWKQVSNGTYHTIAIKTDGTLWGVGYNLYGQLGLGDIVHRSSPVQIGSLTNWKFINVGDEFTVAILGEN